MNQAELRGHIGGHGRGAVPLGGMVAASDEGHPGFPCQVGLRFGNLAGDVGVGAGLDGRLEVVLGAAGAPGQALEGAAIARHHGGRAAQALGEVVASCPMPGMVPGSQVIIIAGPGYDALTAEGIHLNMAAGSSAPGGGLGDEVPCAMMEGVAAYTQTEPEGGPPSTMDPAAMTGIETKKGLGEPFQSGGWKGGHIGTWRGEGEE